MTFWQTIKHDFTEPSRQDPACNSVFEVIFCYPGVWALINYRFAHWFYKRKFRLIARIISGITRLITAVDINPGAKIGSGVFFDHAAGLVIGETAIVGDNCLIYQNVTLGGVSLEKGKRHPTLENGVVVGAGAKILGNITIGAHSKIGANSVVIKDVPANSTAVGVPARILGECDSDPLAHNKLPDINKELMKYLIKRIEILEDCIQNGDKNLCDKEKEINQEYENYLKSLK
ncbi:serine O-acetyltransferase [Campylobacter sp. JMF_08 NE1]|uniref:serine O-acetyltransferase n=1 Tax=Campylobacter sp. JMF_08 NE1 TaxID=2983821 RepID=UPI0022E99DBF|nr:serine O-acetyltransferase [Campylobacter sp. JMF_08 NE1]MDA3047385.1 serine O-acetyltransferase [Campylobacter sp. JMF_08 NE1]